MTRFAENTSVAADRSRGEIERTLTRYGATGFMYGWDEGGAVVGFRAQDRLVRFKLAMPDRDDPRFTLTPGGRRTRSAAQAEAAWEQATRQMWRALLLVVKAKLEAIDAGISTFEQEFLAFITLPDGSSMGEWAAPQIEKAYATATMPALLPGTST
jgi:hypothetical protein